MTELLAKRKRKSSPSTTPSSVRKKPRLDALDARSLTTTPCELLEDELRQKYPLATSHVLRDKEDDADKKFDTNSESYTQDSTLMSTMLKKMGYSDTNRHRTKELLLLFNECNNIFERALNDGIPRCYFSVGSQIECTALPESDDDNLFGPSNEHVAAISSQRDITDGRVNILMVRNGMSPPGHVWLKHLDIKQSQLISKCTRLKSETKDRIDMQVKLYGQCYITIEEVPDVDKHLLCTWPGTLFLDDTDMLFYIPNSLYTLIGKQMWAGKASRTGPSFSSSETDVVRPIFCEYVYPSDQDPLTIGGKLYGNLHVPKEYRCNLDPVGHPESEDSMLEWRISYNLTEREIMFGLNITHIQTYVVLKMLQKNFKQYVGNNFTSYHFKTSLYFTIATTTPTMWREDNMINCVRQCLKMIRMFLKKKFCPHFFNKAFNIFAGKFPRCGKHWDMLIKLVDDFVDNPSSFVKDLKQANERINRIQSVPRETQRFVLNSISLVEQVNKTIVNSAVTPFTQLGNLAPHIRPVDIQKMRFMYRKLRKKLENQIELLPTGKDNKCAKVVLSFVKVRHYLLSVADLMEQGNTPALLLPGNILPDALSMDLQMSSVLFVNGKFEQSLLFLCRVFKKIANDPIFYVQCHQNGRHIPRCDFEEFFTRYNGPLPITDIPAWTFIKRHVSLQVIFLVQELCLLHPLLRFEAYRFLFEDRKNMCRTDDEWWCVVRMDSIPFLFFMQYLVYKELGLEEQKYEALVRLEVCIDYSPMSDRHIAMNMLGICCECELNYNKALRCYARSLTVRPRFNAAKFHIALLVWRLSSKI